MSGTNERSDLIIWRTTQIAQDTTKINGNTTTIRLNRCSKALHGNYVCIQLKYRQHVCATVYTHQLVFMTYFRFICSDFCLCFILQTGLKRGTAFQKTQIESKSHGRHIAGLLLLDNDTEVTGTCKLLADYLVLCPPTHQFQNCVVTIIGSNNSEQI